MSSPVPEEKGPKAEQSQECQGHFDLREGAKHFQVLTYPPYGPDLDPCDFRLFPFIKEKLAERKFSDIHFRTSQKQLIQSSMHCSPLAASSLKPQVEKIVAEEQAGFRAGSSITEQIFNLRVLCEKCLQHQQDLYHVVIDLKKAFDRVWHAALWATMMKKNKISTNLIQVTKNLYNTATSAVLFNNSIRDCFKTTVGVRQGCLLSPTLFKIFLKGS